MPSTNPATPRAPPTPISWACGIFNGHQHPSAEQAELCHAIDDLRHALLDTINGHNGGALPAVGRWVTFDVTALHCDRTDEPDGPRRVGARFTIEVLLRRDGKHVHPDEIFVRAASLLVTPSDFGPGGPAHDRLCPRIREGHPGSCADAPWAAEVRRRPPP